MKKAKKQYVKNHKISKADRVIRLIKIILEAAVILVELAMKFI